MRKITEHTNGTHIYMKMELNGVIEEIDVYIRDDGWTYKTTDRGNTHDEIIKAFNELY